jgi:hypothetical protein
VTITDRPPTEHKTIDQPARRRLSAPQIVGGGVLVLIGFLWLLERTGAIDISVAAVLALGTMVIGISLMLLAREGSHGGLIVFGTILALVTLLTAVAPFEGFQGGVGERVIEVTSVDDIHADYNVAMGTLTIDLRGIDDLRAETPLTASVGMGELVIRVPEGIGVRVDANVGAGEVDILGRTTDGLDIDEIYQSPGFEDSSESLLLDLQVFTGRVEVTDE